MLNGTTKICHPRCAKRPTKRCDETKEIWASTRKSRHQHNNVLTRPFRVVKIKSCVSWMPNVKSQQVKKNYVNSIQLSNIFHFSLGIYNWISKQSFIFFAECLKRQKESTLCVFVFVHVFVGLFLIISEWNNGKIYFKRSNCHLCVILYASRVFL